MSSLNNQFSFKLILILFLSLCMSPLYAHAQSYGPKPLFAKDDVIKLRIEAPLKTLISKAKRSTDPYPGRLTVLEGQAGSYDITLAARGKSRRERFCKFPPLRVKFTNKQQLSGDFRGQKSLKLVTHCSKAEKYEQYALLENSAYRMFNEISPRSLKTRLAKIDYIDSKSGKTLASKYGFFIEDMDDAAERNGMKEIDLATIGSDQLNADSAARNILFHYMIGNLDWSIKKGPPGADCCHNGKLMGATKTSQQNLYATPYDFDHSGLVDASYAEPPETIPIKSLTKRYYRGHCKQTPAVQALFPEFSRKQYAIIGSLDKITALSEKNRAKSKAFMNEFFETINDPKLAQKRIFSKCR